MINISLICLSFNFFLKGMQDYIIENCDFTRDLKAIEQILDENDEYLKCETIGRYNGYTLNFIQNADCITDVLRVNNQTIGFVNYSIEPKTFSHLNYKKLGALNLIGVLANFQNVGYGRILMKHVINQMKNSGKTLLVLAVKKKNIKARYLYESIGFTQIYCADDNEPDLIYKLEIENHNRSMSARGFIYDKELIIAGISLIFSFSYWLLC